MNQIPCMPVNPIPVPQQPSYNAVKIDIHNPSVGVPQMQAPQNAYYNPQYAPVTSPIYNIPQAPIYYPAPMPQPQVPAEQVQTQQPVYYPPVMPQVPQVVQMPQYPAAQIPQQPAIEQQNINYPTPVVVPQPTVAPQPQPQVTVAPQPQPSVPAAEVPAPQVSKAPEVVPPATPEPQVDLNAFISKLANPDFEIQSAAMEDIASMIKETPQKATELVDQKVFDQLNNIISFDSSKLEGPSQAQIDARQKIMEGKEVTEEEKNTANTMAPKELAERNKSYALYTIAMMDKLYADEVKKLTGNDVPLTELPEAVNVVNQLKDNPNPMVRASAIEALSYIQTPEYKKDLTTLFTVAKNDQDAGVVEAANTALAKLEQA